NAVVWLRERDLAGARVKESKAATTGADGRFEIQATDWSAVAAFANGFAPDWASTEGAGGGGTLHLPEELPLHGQTVEPQGKAMRQTIHAPPDGDLRGGYNAFRLNPEWIGSALPRGINNGTAELLPAADTAADGTFQLTGIGKGRVAEIRFSGDGIESARIYV